MKTILITGCNRGIGFGLVKHLCENYRQMENIFATCRNPQSAQVSDQNIKLLIEAQREKYTRELGSKMIARNYASNWHRFIVNTSRCVQHCCKI